MKPLTYLLHINNENRKEKKHENITTKRLNKQYRKNINIF